MQDATELSWDGRKWCRVEGFCGGGVIDGIIGLEVKKEPNIMDDNFSLKRRGIVEREVRPLEKYHWFL